MSKFVHACEVSILGSDFYDCDLWVNAERILDFEPKDGKAVCCVISDEKAVIVVDKWFTEELSDLLSRYVKRPEKPEIDW